MADVSFRFLDAMLLHQDEIVRVLHRRFLVLRTEARVREAVFAYDLPQIVAEAVVQFAATDLDLPAIERFRQYLTEKAAAMAGMPIAWTRI